MVEKIVILGSGESGVGAAILAKKQGMEVFVSDYGKIKPIYKDELSSLEIPFEEGMHSEDIILTATIIVKSPGIADKTPIIKKIKEKNIPIISEIEFGYRFSKAKIIAITGTNGKTTTTSLTYHILEKAGLNVGLGGNIGTSFARQVAAGDKDFFVLEISSFQLDGMYHFKADVAILLNITPDHLDRYEYNFQNYVNSKFRITQNQTSEDVFIFWDDDPVIQSEIARRNILATQYPFSLTKKEHSKAYVENNNLIIETSNNLLIMPVKELSLKGIHNTYNMMAAGLAASAVNVKKEFIRQSLQDFQGVEHRLEYVATVRNVTFINDSKATNVNSCWYALESMKTPVILILGGTDKGNDYSEIESLVKEKVKGLVFLGVDNTPLHRFFDDKIDKIVDVHSMEDAVKAAYSMAEAGDTVLLSPCCASFDLFVNYEDRGKQFKRNVLSL